jgi:hypothetical protein
MRAAGTAKRNALSVGSSITTSPIPYLRQTSTWRASRKVDPVIVILVAAPIAVQPMDQEF